MCIIIKRKISVVTVCYNAASLIGETILSVINQTYPNLEYIIIDGKSKDNTVNIIKKYESKITRWISEPDEGIYYAMNKGLKYATGDYVIFMNAGDTFCHEKILEEFVPQIDEDTIVAYGDIYMVKEHYKYRAAHMSEELLEEKMPFCHQATFVRLNYHKKHPFDTSFKIVSDYNLFYHAYFTEKVKFQYVHCAVANFDSRGLSSANFRLTRREWLRVNGLQHDWIYRIKKELTFISWDIKRWVKHHLMSEKSVAEIEIKRLRKKGIKEIIITSTDL